MSFSADGFAPAILRPPPPICRLGRCHTCGAAIGSRSNQQRDEKWVKLLRFALVLTCRNLLKEFHKDRSEIGECGNRLFLVCARSHRFLKLHVFKLKLFHHVRGKVRVNIQPRASDCILFFSRNVSLFKCRSRQALFLEAVMSEMAPGA